MLMHEAVTYLLSQVDGTFTVCIYPTSSVSCPLLEGLQVVPADGGDHLQRCQYRHSCVYLPEHLCTSFSRKPQGWTSWVAGPRALSTSLPQAGPGSPRSGLSTSMLEPRVRPPLAGRPRPAPQSFPGTQQAPQTSLFCQQDQQPSSWLLIRSQENYSLTLGLFHFLQHLGLGRLCSQATGSKETEYYQLWS